MTVSSSAAAGLRDAQPLRESEAAAQFGSPLRILLFSADYTPDPGGIAMHVHELSRALAARGASVTVIGGSSRLPRHPNTRPSNPYLNEIRLRRAGPPGLRGLGFLARARRALEDAARRSWDVVHFHNFFPDGLLLGGWKHARTRIMTNHSSWYLVDVERGRRRRLLRWLTRGVNGIIGPSHELADKSGWIGRPDQEIKYIPNGVDLKRFAPDGESTLPAVLRDVPTAAPILLSVRRHDPSKSGLPYLIRAMPEVLRRRPDVILCLAGDGPETHELMRVAEALALGRSVRFLGRVPNEELPPLYRAACLSILPSLYEAVSLSGLESLASGRPVIGTRVGGIPEFILEGRTGLLVPARSSEALAAAVLDLLSSDERRRAMGEEGRRLVEREFSWARVAERTVSFYEHCLQMRC